MRTRADAKKLMSDIAEVYRKSLEEISAYWKESDEKRIFESGRERVIAAEPPEKRLDEVRELKSKAYGKILALKGKWQAEEDLYFALNGADVTDDFKLLNDVISPSVEQLKSLAEKYFGKNWTMEQAIVNFANGKDKYKSVMELPRVQPKEERWEIIQFYDEKMMKPMYENSANRINQPLKSYDYQNAYTLIRDKWLQKIS